jgi:hypothetical protein
MRHSAAARPGANPSQMCGKQVTGGRRPLMSVLAQCFADPALGELVLAYDALGVDAQQHVHAVPGPLRHLGR